MCKHRLGVETTRQCVASATVCNAPKSQGAKVETAKDLVDRLVDMGCVAMMVMMGMA